MIEFLKSLWQLPQVMIAFIYYIYLEQRGEILCSYLLQGAIVIVRKSYYGSMTLGNFIFLSSRASDRIIKHEWGHARQSLILGPLYLLVVGLPSIIWAAFHKSIAPDKPYDWFYTESWANRLCGINMEL